MSKYYRVIDDNSRQIGDTFLGVTNTRLRPIEVGEILADHISAFRRNYCDDWHPASEPPKPEDFEPTGYVLCLSVKPALLAPELKAQAWLWKKGSKRDPISNMTHWCTITLPFDEEAHRRKAEDTPA